MRCPVSSHCSRLAKNLCCKGFEECLQSVFDLFNMQNVITEATRVTLSSCTLIDLIVTTRKDLITSSGVFPLGISDHSLIYATMKLKNKRPPPKRIIVRDYKRLDLDSFRHDLATAPFNIASVFDEADDVLWAWQNLFNDICNNHAPWKQVKIRSTSAPWISDEIRYKMNRRYKLFKKAINTKCPSLWQEYKRARNEVTSALRLAKASYFSNMFDEVKNTTAYWKLLNKATNPTLRKSIGPLKREDGTLAQSDEEKAALMNSHFSTIGERLADELPPPPPVTEGQESEAMHNPRAIPHSLEKITVSQGTVRKKVEMLKTNKSTGPDNIPPKLLKLAGAAVVPALVTLFRYSIERGVIFSSWKTARLAPIFKKDDETDMGNYRPISLLSVPGKIMESEINDNLVQHIFKSNNLASDNQWAYRAGHSTELLLIHLTETWRRALDSGKAVAAAFVDFKKAFDSVPHDILLTKLNRDFGVTGSLLDLIRNYLSGRQQFTVLNGVKSELLPVRMGIPQGSVLGPTLFVLFTNDLPSSVPTGSVYMYADDTTVFCIGETADLAIAKLNKALREFYNWCLNNRLTPHPSKSEVILFTKGTPMGPIAPVYLGNSVLSLVTKTRLLGLTVDQKLTWVANVLEIKRTFAKKLDLLKRSRFLPRGILKDFYFKVIVPAVKYGLVLWGSCCKSDLLNSIERLHCRAARIIYNLPKDMASDEVLRRVQWPTFFLYYKLDVLRLFYKAHSESLPDTLSETICQNRVNTYFTREQNCLLVPRCESRYMKDSLSYRGSSLWNFVNYNDKEAAASPNFNYLRKRVSAENFFKDFKFNCTSASTTRYKQQNFVYY